MVNAGDVAQTVEASEEPIVIAASFVRCRVTKRTGLGGEQFLVFFEKHSFNFADFISVSQRNRGAVVDDSPSLRPGEDNPALGEGPDLVVDQGEL